LARNRYGWQKRAKEIARKQKNDDKMKRRQGKIITLSEEEMPASEEGSEEGMEGLGETDSVETELPAGSPQPD
jgi:hypothetical protein